MTIQLRVDLDAATPVYEQLRSQIAGHIGAGHLAGGERLPTVRALALDLGIAVNTVNRAYTELEAAGLVTTRRRVGTVVTTRAPTTGIPAVRAAADLFAAAAIDGALTDDAAVDLLRVALRRARERAAPGPDT